MDAHSRRGAGRVAGIVLALVSLAVVILCLVRYAGIRRIQALSLDDQISVQVQAPGGTVSTYPYSHQFEAPAKGSTITVTVHLPEEEQIDDAALCFYNYNSVVTVRYQGQTLYQHGGGRAGGRTDHRPHGGEGFPARRGVGQ